MRDGFNSLKSKLKLTKPDVEQFGRDLDLLEDRLLVLETTSKSISCRVTALIATVPKKATGIVPWGHSAGGIV